MGARAYPEENPTSSPPWGPSGHPLRRCIPGAGWRPPGSERWPGAPALPSTCPTFLPTKGQGAQASFSPKGSSLGKVPTGEGPDWQM